MIISKRDSYIMATTTPPLSWDEARGSLRDILKNYLDISLHKRDDVGIGHSVLPDKHESILALCIRCNFDLYAGAIVLSMLLLISSSLSFHYKLNKVEYSYLNPEASLSIYCSELVGALVLVIASLINTWVVRRWRFLCWNDKENAKRREILKFLRGPLSNDHHFDQSAPSSPNVDMSETGPDTVARIQLTSQTEVFPVFRKCGNSLSWASVPSLLLVKGDWVALQVGDIAPANCTAFSKDMTTIHICAGELVTTETFRCTVESVTSNLPQVRATLTSHLPDHFLTLCNNMHICTVVDSPILASLNRSTGTS